MVGFRTLECYQTYLILDVKMQDVTAVVKTLIAVGRPDNSVGIDYVSEIIQWDAEVLGPWVVCEDCIPE